MLGDGLLDRKQIERRILVHVPGAPNGIWVTSPEEIAWREKVLEAGYAVTPFNVAGVESQAVAGVPVQVFDASTAGTLFGRGSQAAIMVAATITANRYAQITVLPLADSGTGVAAAGTLTFTGPATAAGSVTATLAGRSVTVAVASGDTVACSSLTYTAPV